MITYYCCNCDTEVYWDDEVKCYRCPECNRYLTEDEVNMLEDDVDNLEAHL